MEERTLREQVPEWVAELRQVASKRPATGACAVATAMELWAWTFDRMQAAATVGTMDVEGFATPLADALGRLMAARAFVLDASGVDVAQPDGSVVLHLCHAHVAHTAGEVGRICAELVFGSLRHPAWETDSAQCYHAADLEMLEEYVPGLASCARAYSDVIEADGSHPPKAGPCVRLDGFEEYIQLRTRLDGCLAGGYIARQRAARGLAKR